MEKLSFLQWEISVTRRGLLVMDSHKFNKFLGY